MLVEMKVRGLALDPVSNMPIIILRDEDDKRSLPIWVGIFEANAIALELEKIPTPRPMTHDLIKNILESLEAQVLKIVVTDLKDNTFFAVLHLKLGDTEYTVDSRPSDAIALALQRGRPDLRGGGGLPKAGQDGGRQGGDGAGQDRRSGAAARVAAEHQAGGLREVQQGLTARMRVALFTNNYTPFCGGRDHLRRDAAPRPRGPRPRGPGCSRRASPAPSPIRRACCATPRSRPPRIRSSHLAIPCCAIGHRGAGARARRRRPSNAQPPVLVGAGGGAAGAPARAPARVSPTTPATRSTPTTCRSRGRWWSARQVALSARFARRADAVDRALGAGPRRARAARRPRARRGGAHRRRSGPLPSRRARRGPARARPVAGRAAAPLRRSPGPREVRRARAPGLRPRRGHAAARAAGRGRAGQGGGQPCARWRRGCRPPQRVQFLGARPHEALPVCYQAADLFLFASETETQGLVLAEAAACGMAAVAVAAPGCDEVVRDGRHGRAGEARGTRARRGRHRAAARSRPARGRWRRAPSRAVAEARVRRPPADRSHAGRPTPRSSRRAVAADGRRAARDPRELPPRVRRARGPGACWPPTRACARCAACSCRIPTSATSCPTASAWRRPPTRARWRRSCASSSASSGW